jgi:hypothetical protein
LGGYVTTVTSGRYSDNKQRYAGNTVEQILTGKQFNRDIRGFTFLFYSLIIYIAAIGRGAQGYQALTILLAGLSHKIVDQMLE